MNSRPTTTDALRCVGLVGNPWYRHFYPQLGRELKSRFGSRLVLFASSREAANLFRTCAPDDLYDTIEVIPSLVTMPIPMVEDRAMTVAAARRNEENYGVTYNWMAVPDRLYGKGYALGGFYHPRSRHSEGADYWQLLEAYNQQVGLWATALQTLQITALVEANLLQGTVAERHGILVRNFIPARHKNLYYWTDTFGFCELAAAKYHSGAPLNPDEQLAGVPFQGALFNDEARRRFRISGMMRDILAHTRNYVQWHLTGYHKSDLYRYRDMVALAIRRVRSFRQVTGRCTTKLSDLAGQRFVFFALHVEPEIWFQGRSPEWTYQLATIVSLSRDLPAGVRLAVKEHHPAVGRRPDRFYDQIKTLKNVVLLDIEEKGQEIIKQASAVATICGTAGHEGAILGKRVICFGRHNLFRILPNSRTITREEDLRGALQWALELEQPHDGERRAGERFLGAVVSSSFDMREFTVRNLMGYGDDTAARACDRLAESLEPALASLAERAKNAQLAQSPA